MKVDQILKVFVVQLRSQALLVYYDHENQVMVETDNPVTYGNTTGGTWHGVVSQFSANPEAAYAYLIIHGN